MAQITIFGIKNCDTMKKAFLWLDSKRVPYTFYDFKKETLTELEVQLWLSDLSIDEIINKKGTTWRKCSEAEKESIADPKKAIQLIIKNPSIVKRPLVQMGKKYIVGFIPEQWDIFFHDLKPICFK